ncbi:MAG TPA: hypothetical protein PLV43_12590, partial [Aequorivita sp.]|nr:hypothetical protein [Aequorivita sp.]
MKTPYKNIYAILKMNRFIVLAVIICATLSSFFSVWMAYNINKKALNSAFAINTDGSIIPLKLIAQKGWDNIAANIQEIAVKADATQAEVDEAVASLSTENLIELTAAELTTLADQGNAYTLETALADVILSPEALGILKELGTDVTVTVTENDDS